MRFRISLTAFAAAVLFSAAAWAEGDDSAAFRPDAIPIGQTDALEAVRLPPSALPAQEHYVAIYSGSTKGTYFYIASAICAAMHASFNQHQIRCVALRSQGVASNVDLMRQGRAQFAIVQSDTNEAVAAGRIDLPMGRSVMSLHDELGGLVVSGRSAIARVADLRGKRVNIGPAESASRHLWDTLLAAEGLRHEDLGTTYAAVQDFNQRGLCDGYLDAFGLWIGHPAPTIAASIANCGARVLGLRSPAVERMVAQTPYFFWGEIPAGTYPGQTAAIASYGFKASLIADRRVDPYLAYWMARSVRENIDLFRSHHPALAAVKPRDMFEKGNFMPFHEGAARYWREVGWLSDDVAK